MKIIPLLVLILLTSLTSQSGLCQSQAEMNMETSAELEREDKILNTTYQKLLTDRAGEAQFCTNLRDAQRAWLKFVELHLNSTFPLEDGESPREKYGSVYPSEFAIIKTELIQARIEQLKALSGEEGQ